MDKKVLRKGYTTGTCAAAGAKAAAQALFDRLKGKRRRLAFVRVTLPSGGSLKIPVESVTVEGRRAAAVIIKDAGDDPDVTNGARFVSEVELLSTGAKRPLIKIKGGHGVGVVTRPGLKIGPGRPAINPVPLKMIRRALLEAAGEAGETPSLVYTISVPDGLLLAAKTMNPRLGITGGISILGTTGIVEPMSLAAYRHSISLGIDVALASGLDCVVFSTGRSSEKAVEKETGLPEVAYVLTGDHMGYALREASRKKGLKRVTVAGQFGKMSKLAAGHFETHCSDSSVELDFLAALCKDSGADEKIIERVLAANTAREVFFLLKKEGLDDIFKKLCALVRENSARIVGKGKGIKVTARLAGYNNDMACTC